MGFHFGKVIMKRIILALLAGACMAGAGSDMAGENMRALEQLPVRQMQGCRGFTPTP
jgi:hypothetical protein